MKLELVEDIADESALTRLSHALHRATSDGFKIGSIRLSEADLASITSELPPAAAALPEGAVAVIFGIPCTLAPATCLIEAD
jgi:hypothetical protein